MNFSYSKTENLEEIANRINYNISNIHTFF